jgi:hypothetical protein
MLIWLMLASPAYVDAPPTDDAVMLSRGLRRSAANDPPVEVDDVNVDSLDVSSDPGASGRRPLDGVMSGVMVNSGVRERERERSTLAPASALPGASWWTPFVRALFCGVE